MNPRRRRTAAGAAVVLAATLLAACSSETGPPVLTWYINPDAGGQEAPKVSDEDAAKS